MAVDCLISTAKQNFFARFTFAATGRLENRVPVRIAERASIAAVPRPG